MATDNTDYLKYINFLRNSFAQNKEKDITANNQIYTQLYDWQQQINRVMNANQTQELKLLLIDKFKDNGLDAFEGKMYLASDRTFMLRGANNKLIVVDYIFISGDKITFTASWLNFNDNHIFLFIQEEKIMMITVEDLKRYSEKDFANRSTKLDKAGLSELFTLTNEEMIKIKSYLS